MTPTLCARCGFEKERAWHDLFFPPEMPFDGPKVPWKGAVTHAFVPPKESPK